jgi:hypothetical protein
MSGGWFQPRRLQFNETITYRCAFVAPQNPTAPPQVESEGPYRGKVVDFTAAGMVGVRADGWWGEAPLYYVLTGDILTVEPIVDTTGNEDERQQARLARRERDVPVPEPDSPEALVATLADWGAEHRPQEPCSTCGCTLYWTAAGDVMCAICLPMPRLTEGSRERIARLFPRTLRGAHESAGRPAVRVSTGASARPA